MRTFAICVLLTFGLLFSQGAIAANKVVAADLTEDFIGVSEGFGGAKLTVFGVLKGRKSDAVVVIEGPPSQAKVRKKTKQYGIWVNGEPEVLEPVPGFYAVVSSRPIEAIVEGEAARQYGLDMQHLSFSGTDAGKGFTDDRKARSLYQYRPDGVKVLESNLFRADVVFPANVPIGPYKAYIYEFSGKKLTAMRTETINIAQIGIASWISTIARENALFYAVLALCCSLGIGGVAAYMFRKVS